MLNLETVFSALPFPTSRKFFLTIEHALIFVGDLLPYGVTLLLTLMVGYRLGLEQVGFLSLTYFYVAILSTLVCGPNMLSLRRRMSETASAGAVVAASLTLRTAVIFIGSIVILSAFYYADAKRGMIPLAALLFVGRLFETSVDGPAISVQYNRGALEYFILRFLVFIIVGGISAFGVLFYGSYGLNYIGVFYIIGGASGFVLSSLISKQIIFPISKIHEEFLYQFDEFKKFFLVTALFTVLSRFHPIVITYFSGLEAAGHFAAVQNLFSILVLAATAIGGVFFWSQSRDGASDGKTSGLVAWLIGAIPLGLVLGVVGGATIDLLFLEKIGSSPEIRSVSWVLCLSTPLLMTQAIISNYLVLKRRDGQMLAFSTFNALVILLLIIILTYFYGLLGAALSVGSSALLSTVVGLVLVRRVRA